jgi:hypothetical protein
MGAQQPGIWHGAHRTSTARPSILGSPRSSQEIAVIARMQVDEGLLAVRHFWQFKPGAGLPVVGSGPFHFQAEQQGRRHAQAAAVESHDCASPMALATSRRRLRSIRAQWRETAQPMCSLVSMPARPARMHLKITTSGPTTAVA